MKPASAKQQALRMSALMAPAALITLIISVPVGIFTSAVLGPTLSGVLRVVTLIQQYFGYNHFGLLQGMGRQVTIALGRKNTEEAKQITHIAFTGNALATLISILALWILYLSGFTFGGILVPWIVVVISILLSVERLDSLLHTHAKSHGCFDLISRRKLFLSIVTPVLTVAGVALFRLHGALIAILLTSVVGTAYYLLGLRHDLSWRFWFPLRKAAGIASIGLVIFANHYLAAVLDTVGLTILASAGSATQVGLVSFATRPLAIAGDLAMSFNLVASRHMLLRRGGQQVVRQSHFADYLGSPFSSYVLLIVLLQGSIYLGYSFLTRMFLPKFLGALPILSILLFRGMLHPTITYTEMYMNATDQLGKRLLMIGPMIGLNAGLTVFLLGRGFGMASVAWAATSSYSVFASVGIYLAIQQTTRRHVSAVTQCLRVLLALGLATLLAVRLDSWNLINPADTSTLVSRILVGMVELVPKLLIYLASTLVIFAITFWEHRLLTEVREGARYMWGIVTNSLRAAGRQDSTSNLGEK